MASQVLFLNAEEADILTSIQGKVAFPEKVHEGINIEGLALKDAVILLEGKYNHPRMPYPENWREMTPKERRAWNDKFKSSEEYAEYQKKVEDAQAKRFRKKAEIAEDGSFVFEGIKPSWYQLTVKITPPNAPHSSDFSYSRAYALRQFFVKDPKQPLNLNTVTLKLKNVLIAGQTAPDFTIANYKGGTFKLSDFRGKYVLFDFWATWCGPCIAQIPNLEAVSEKYEGENFVTLGLSVDEKLDAAEGFLKKRPSHYKQGYVGADDVYPPIRTAYGIGNIPSIWLIDPEGKIIARDLMGKRILEEVEKALGAAKK